MDGEPPQVVKLFGGLAINKGVEVNVSEILALVRAVVLGSFIVIVNVLVVPSRKVAGENALVTVTGEPVRVMPAVAGEAFFAP